MQNKELFKEFVAFCQAQPADKSIDNDSWESCAVGEFALTKGVNVADKTWVGYSYISPELNIFIGELLGDIPSNGLGFSENALTKTMACRTLCPKHYGVLAELLQQFV